MKLKNNIKILLSVLSITAILSTTASANILLPLPQDSSEYQQELALAAVQLCAGQTREYTADALIRVGFSVVSEVHYDKPADDVFHTCAFSIGKGETVKNGTQRDVYAIVIRGTSGMEWAANFDPKPSYNFSSAFNEDFLMAAEDVFLSFYEQCPPEKNDPVIFVCGHSRGAAAANLLGLLLNAVYDPKDIYVYTSATPNTICEQPAVFDENIFNIINTSDLVPYVPLSTWGFFRPGTDIELSGEEALKEERIYLESVFDHTAKTIESFYQDRHSLDVAGLSDDGITSFEVMLLLTQALAELPAVYQEGKDTQMDLDTDQLSEDSDLYPLWNALMDLTENENERGKKLLTQHMPQTYLELMQEG